MNAGLIYSVILNAIALFSSGSECRDTHSRTSVFGNFRFSRQPISTFQRCFVLNGFLNIKNATVMHILGCFIRHPV
jgi:hypothetical protein